MDWQVNDIVAHTSQDNSVPANVTWTSPIAGTVDISGAVWAGRDIGRGNDWHIYLNSELLTHGTVASGDEYSRASPMAFALGSGTASALQNVSVQVDDVVRLEFERASQEDYVGMNFTIDATAIPEPSTLVALVGLLGMGLIGRSWQSRRKRARATRA